MLGGCLTEGSNGDFFLYNKSPLKITEEKMCCSLFSPAAVVPDSQEKLADLNNRRKFGFEFKIIFFLHPQIRKSVEKLITHN